MGVESRGLVPVSFFGFSVAIPLILCRSCFNCKSHYTRSCEGSRGRQTSSGSATGTGRSGRFSSPIVSITAPILLSRHSHLRLSLGSGLLPLTLLLVSLLGIPVEEKVGHHLPWHVTRD